MELCHHHEIIWVEFLYKTRMSICNLFHLPVKGSKSYSLYGDSLVQLADQNVEKGETSKRIASLVNQPKTVHVCFRLLNQSNCLVVVHLLFCFCSHEIISRSYQNCSIIFKLNRVYSQITKHSSFHL